MTKTILTADDSAGMRQMIALTLRHAGYEVIEAVDGQDALDKLGRTTVQMVLTDFNMPKVNGLQLIQRVRALPGYTDIPIVMVTTESDDTKKQLGRTVGATDWAVKPFRADQLIGVVKRLLG